MGWRSYGWVVPAGQDYATGYVPEQDSTWYDDASYDALDVYQDMVDYVTTTVPDQDYAEPLAALWAALDRGEGYRFLLYVEGDGTATYEVVEPYSE